MKIVVHFKQIKYNLFNRVNIFVRLVFNTNKYLTKNQNVPDSLIYVWIVPVKHILIKLNIVVHQHTFIIHI